MRWYDNLWIMNGILVFIAACSVLLGVSVDRVYLSHKIPVRVEAPLSANAPVTRWNTVNAPGDTIVIDDPLWVKAAAQAGRIDNLNLRLNRQVEVINSQIAINTENMRRLSIVEAELTKMKKGVK